MPDNALMPRELFAGVCSARKSASARPPVHMFYSRHAVKCEMSGFVLRPWAMRNCKCNVCCACASVRLCSCSGRRRASGVFSLLAFPCVPRSGKVHRGGVRRIVELCHSFLPSFLNSWLSGSPFASLSLSLNDTPFLNLRSVSEHLG